MLIMKVEMIDINDTKAIAIYGNIKMLPFCISSFAVSILLLIPSFIFHIYELLFVFILPVLLLIIMIMKYMVNSLTIFDEQERKYFHVYGM